jgi:hypothetical protein
MRQVQIVILVVGVLSLIASAFGLGKDFGETLYKTGIALLLIDLVCMQLWPLGKRL